MRIQYLDRWSTCKCEQLLWKEAAAEMALASKHTMRQGGRVLGIVGSVRSVPGLWPKELTHIARSETNSTRTSDWPPLSEGTLHHRKVHKSRCGTAPRAGQAASIHEIERSARVALQKNACGHSKTLYPGRYADYMTETTTAGRFTLPRL